MSLYETKVFSMEEREMGFKDLTFSTIHLLILIFFSRITAQTGLRIIYALAPFLEDEWDLESDDFGLILSISEFAAVFGVVLAPFADKFGTKLISFFAYFLMTLSFVVLTFNQNFLVVLFSRMFFVIGYQMFFATTVSVTFGAVPKELGVKVATFIELSWGLSTLLGLPFTIFIFDRLGFKVLFSGFSVIMCVFSFDILKQYPTYHLQEGHKHESKEITLSQVLRSLSHRSVLSFNANTIFVVLAQNGMFTVFSFWMNNKFDVDIDEIGLPYFIIGAADILGALSINLVIFKIPKRAYLVTYIFILISIFTLLLLNLANQYESLVLALFGCFVFFLTAQFVIIFKITETPAYAEDKFRTSVIASHSISMFIGRASGAYLGEKLYSTQPFNFLVYIFSFGTFLSIVLLRYAEKTKRTFENVQEKKEETKDQGTDNITDFNDTAAVTEKDKIALS